MKSTIVRVLIILLGITAVYQYREPEKVYALAKKTIREMVIYYQGAD